MRTNKHVMRTNMCDVEYAHSDPVTDLVWKSDTSVEVEKDSAEKLFKLLNALEDNDDVQGVSSNFEVSEEILASLT